MASEPGGMRVYVAGPYTATHPREFQKNVDRAIDIGIALVKKGHFPFVPHFTHYMDIRPQCDLDWQDYMKLDDKWLEQCQAFFYIGSSKGADIELEKAKKMNIPIFTKLEDVPDAK